MGLRLNRIPRARQPQEHVGPNPDWLSRRLSYLWGWPNGSSNWRLLNLVDGTSADLLDPNNDFAVAVTPFGQAGRNRATSNAGNCIYTASSGVLSGAQELTLLAWFVFGSADDNAQWMNFRTDLQHTLDVFAKTSTSVTWGADWAGAWNGASQQTLSGLVDGDFVCIGASINQSGARFFANGRYSGTKSGSGFTTSSSSVAVARATRASQLGAAAFRAALSDADMQALTGNPWQLFEDEALPVTRAAAGATLTIADATHGHTADAPALTQVHQLATADATHAQTVDALNLSQVHALVAQDAAHGHQTDTLTLSQVHLIAVADALHAHAADHLNLSGVATLAISDAIHAHGTDAVTLGAGATLAIADALHTHAADALALGQVHVMVVSDAIHAQLVSAVALSLPGAVLVGERCLVIPTETRALIVLAESRALAIAAEIRVLTIH